jgi:hypothetical protein
MALLLGEHGAGFRGFPSESSRGSSSSLVDKVADAKLIESKKLLSERVLHPFECSQRLLVRVFYEASFLLLSGVKRGLG